MERSLRWSVVWAFFFVLWPSAQSSAQIINFEGDASERVYGKNLCDSLRTIQFRWGFSPSTGQPPTSLTLKMWLGSKDGPALFQGNVDLTQIQTNVNANPADPNFIGTIAVPFDGLLNRSKDTSRGLYNDDDKQTTLTIRDIIGYRRFLDEGKLTPYDDICKLSEARLGGELSADIFLEVTYASFQQIGGTGTQTISNNLSVRFDLSPPPKPDAPEVIIGDAKLDLRLNKVDAENYFSYDIYYSNQAFTSVEEQGVVKAATQITAANYTLLRLVNEQKYFIAVVAYDRAGNPSELSELVEASPIPLEDFFEAYKRNGGADKGFQGGFCFLATAAYGAYDAREVQALRALRDRFLMPSALGRAFVARYYRYSPPLATWIAKHPRARRIAQIALWPLVQMAYLWLWSPWLGILFTLGLASFFLWLSFSLTRKLWRMFYSSSSFSPHARPAVLHSLRLLGLPASTRKTPTKRLFSFFGLFLCLLLFLFGGASAHADVKESPRNFGIEFRGGPYFAKIDQETGLANNPFVSFFGEGPLPYLEVGFEWLFFKDMGSLGLGVSVGVSWAEGLALRPDGSQDPNNTTAFWMIPLRLELIYRMDYFANRYRFPLVPYIRGGLAYHIWLATDSAGALAKYQTTGGEEISGIGGRFGFHFGLGLQFLLDVLDPATARTFDIEVGVNRTYLFVEWAVSWIGILTPGLDLSDNSIRAGLMFQF